MFGIDWLAVFDWLELTWIGETVRKSLWLFPVIEAFHLVALALLGGAGLLMGLHLMGLIMPNSKPSEVYANIHRWFDLGLAVLLLSGIPLFLSEAIKCYYNEPFWMKMIFLLLGLIFHYGVVRSFAKTDGRTRRRVAKWVWWGGVGLLLFLVPPGVNWWPLGVATWILLILFQRYMTPVLIGDKDLEKLSLTFSGAIIGLTSMILWAGVAWGGRWIGFWG